MASKAEPYHMTPEQIAPHQVPVTSVTFIKEHQAITGDRWRAYRAPDGEVAEVRTRCGAYADGMPGCEPWTDSQAREHAITSLNAMRKGRLGRMLRGEPVTCQLRPTGGWPK